MWSQAQAFTSLLFSIAECDNSVGLLAATVERIDVGTPHVTGGRALLVCACEDEAKCREGRLEGSTPLARFETMAATLPRTQEIIFYCA